MPSEDSDQPVHPLSPISRRYLPEALDSWLSMEMICVSVVLLYKIIGPDKSGYQENIFLISP